MNYGGCQENADNLAQPDDTHFKGDHAIEVAFHIEMKCIGHTRFSFEVLDSRYFVKTGEPGHSGPLI